MKQSRRSRAYHAGFRQLIAMLVLALSSGWSGAVPSGSSGYSELVRRVAPSVVTVIVDEERISAADRAAARVVAATAPDAVSSIIRRLLSGLTEVPNDDEDASRSLGSGFVVRADDLIVTNNHVIAGAHTVRVRLAGGQEMAATIVGADAVTDVALLRIEAGRLPALHLGSSRSVSVGDAVIAIGNPFGLGQSVSAGIVSARARMLEDDPYIDFLQTDAAINRGNSGGPLVSADGSVIGVTSTIFSPSGGSVGIGFAIPAETVAAVVAELESHGFVERGYLGISGQDLTPVLAAALAMKRPSGALITDVDAQGPSAGALQIGDVLFDVANQAVTFKNLAKVAARLKPDSLVAMTVLRDGARQSVAVKVGRMPQPPANPAKTGGRDTWVSALKIGVAATTAPIRKAIKAEDEAHGLIITQLRPAGPGALAGLRVGDLITHIGAKPINEVADIEAVGAPSVIAPLLLRVVREGSPVYVGINGEEPP